MVHYDIIADNSCSECPNAFNGQILKFKGLPPLTDAYQLPPMSVSESSEQMPPTFTSLAEYFDFEKFDAFGGTDITNQPPVDASHPDPFDVFGLGSLGDTQGPSTGIQRTQPGTLLAASFPDSFGAPTGERSRVIDLPEPPFAVLLGIEKVLHGTKKRRPQTDVEKEAEEDLISKKLLETKFGPVSEFSRIMVLFYEVVEGATFDNCFIRESKANVHVWMTDAVKLFIKIYSENAVPGKSLLFQVTSHCQLIIFVFRFEPD
jgi:hypothetical protein